MSLLQQLPQGSRIAVIRLRSLGDCVLTTPALRVLHEYRPDLAVAVSLEERFRAVLDRHPFVEAILDPTWQAVRRWRPELCINLHGGTRSLWMTALSGARWRAGFAHHSVTLPYNLRIPRAQKILGVNRTVHTAEHLASVMFALGAPLREIPRAELFASATPIPGRYAVIHPFASEADKCWPEKYFCEVARYLALWGIQPIFLSGPSDDASPYTQHFVFSGTLEDAKRLLSGAVLFLGNDSGPAHVAAAFGIPSLVLFGSSNPAIWGPWRTECEIVVAPDGLRNVPPSRVIAAIERLTQFEEAHA